MDAVAARQWIAAIAADVASQVDYLTQLDSAVGDADHGVNMNRGFTAVVQALAERETAGVAEVLTTAGTVLLSKVGGASGPLFGSAFRAMGRALPAGSPVGAAEFAVALRAGLEAVRKLGAAEVGDKTIVDAYSPAADAFASAAGDGLAAAARAAAAAAADGMRSTTALQARKGRASYLGARSVGHQDPGATSTWMIFQALATVTNGPSS